MSNLTVIAARLNAELYATEPNALDAWAERYGTEFVEHFEDDVIEPQKFLCKRAAENNS